MWPLVTGFSYLLTWCFHGTSILEHALELHSFSWLGNIPLCGYPSFGFSSHQFVWAISTFWVLQILLLWTLVYTFCVDVCFYFP